MYFSFTVPSVPAVYHLATTSLCPPLQSVDPSDKNNGQRRAEIKTPGGETRAHAHGDEYAEHKREAAQADGVDRVINKWVEGKTNDTRADVTQRPFVWAACCGRGPTAWPRCWSASSAPASAAGWTDCAGSGPRSSAAPDAHTPSSGLHPTPGSPSSQKPPSAPSTGQILRV